jgi:small multidrug resistance pump
MHAGLPSMVAVAFYAVSFYLLTLTLRTVPTGIAYAIWSGLGMGLIIAGVVVINVFSRSAGH